MRQISYIKGSSLCVSVCTSMYSNSELSISSTNPGGESGCKSSSSISNCFTVLYQGASFDYQRTKSTVTGVFPSELNRLEFSTPRSKRSDVPGKLPLTLPLAWFHNIDWSLKLSPKSSELKIHDYDHFSRSFSISVIAVDSIYCRFPVRKTESTTHVTAAMFVWIKANTYPLMHCKISAPKSMLKSVFQRMPWHF